MAAATLSPEDYHPRGVHQIVHGQETSDGAGVNMRRIIASPELDMLDPFLLLDAFSSDNPDDYIGGFPPHPHRGFETVTYLLAGKMQHRDSAGHEGLLRSGGVQWMTAGSGIEHSEMPLQEDGELSGFQLWINLPAAKKMDSPRYQEIDPEEVPTETRDNGVTLKVIAGTTSQGTSGSVTEVETDPSYFDVSVPAGIEYIESVTSSHNAFLYLIAGEVNIGNSRISAGQLAVLDAGNYLQLNAVEESRFLLVAGRPVNEPVARGGPFVMNSEEEIRQAFRDYRAGKFGFIEEG